LLAQEHFPKSTKFRFDHEQMACKPAKERQLGAPARGAEIAGGLAKSSRSKDWEACALVFRGASFRGSHGGALVDFDTRRAAAIREVGTEIQADRREFRLVCG
jgi:hypothetical protein